MIGVLSINDAIIKGQQKDIFTMHDLFPNIYSFLATSIYCFINEFPRIPSVLLNFMLGNIILIICVE